MITCFSTALSLLRFGEICKAGIVPAQLSPISASGLVGAKLGFFLPLCFWFADWKIKKTDNNQLLCLDWNNAFRVFDVV